MDRVVHQSIDEVAGKYRFRARGSIVLAAVLGAIGLVMIAFSADKVDPALAIFIGGAALGVCAWTMIIGWGASDGHGDLARLAANGHERMHALLVDRLNEIEKAERSTCNAVIVALDEVRERRRLREG